MTMTDNLFIAIPIIAVGALAWDVARRWMTLTHGRLMSADKTQSLERNVSTLHDRVKLLEADVIKAADKLVNYDKRLDDAFKHINERIDEVSHRVGNLTDEMVKRDKAITNVAEEVQKIREKEVMTLAAPLGGIPRPSKGFSSR